MIALNIRSKSSQQSRVHIARTEAMVEKYANAFARQSAIFRLRWLRYVLAQVLPVLERTIFARAYSSDEISLAQIIRQAAMDFETPDLLATLDGMEQQIILQYGFLPQDPRAEVLRREFQRLLRSDLFQSWATLTSPERLASRLADLRKQNYSTAQIITRLQLEYGATYYNAERMVRTLYNSGANRAQFEILRAQGYTHIQWITARDSRVRRARDGSIFDHVRMDKVIVPLGQPFITPAKSKMLFPGDRSYNAPAGDIVNCRCTIVGVTRA